MQAPQVISILLVAVGSYLAGAIPFSYIAGKVFAGIDLRRCGSGNLGASNTYRLLGGKIALAVLVADVAKGFFPVFLARVYAPPGAVFAHWLMLLAAFFAVIGHMFSIFVGFSGGKGIATTAGAFLALSPLALGITAGLFAVVFAARRIVSLASITGAMLLPFVVFLLDKTGVERCHWSVLVLSIVIAVVVLVKHQSNMKRLLAGEEPALRRLEKTGR